MGATTQIYAFLMHLTLIYWPLDAFSAGVSCDALSISCNALYSTGVDCDTDHNKRLVGAIEQKNRHRQEKTYT
jgi:hypothetical protein